MESLTEEEKRALRGSKFAPLPTAPSSSSSKPQPRLAHPGGPMKTNKAAALAKFLERKMQDPNGMASMDPKLIELAVKNAKDTLTAGEGSKSGRIIHHVDSFGDSEESDEVEVKICVSKKNKKKKRKNKNKNKKRKNLENSTKGKTKKSKKKMKI